jgi:hypothetical protein
MPFDVKIILPSSLKSSYLKSEFIAEGQTYTTNKFSKDPNLDLNRNSLVFTFELRDKTTRELVNLTRIKTLSISNDPNFEPSATFNIVNWPADPLTFSLSYDYSYTFNPAYFFDTTQTQGTMASPSAGTGLFKIYNWPLSASGGLSTIYIKAILVGPGGGEAEYPSGYGVYDQIIWQGTIPVNPSYPQYLSIKDGWMGKNSLVGFKEGNDTSTSYNTKGIARYQLSSYEISSTGSSADVWSANSTVTRSMIPQVSAGSTGCTTYHFYNSSGTALYSATSLSLGSAIGLTSASFGQGKSFYSNTKLTSTSSKPDIYTQAAFQYTIGSIGVTSQLYLKLYDAPETSASSNEIALRIDVPNDSYPVAYLYNIDNGVISTEKQTTTLDSSMTPLFQNGGLLEMYYSAIASTHAYVEAYFTPSSQDGQESSRSYLVANTLINSLGTTLGSAFSYQIVGATGSTGTIKLDELMLAQGKSKLSVDIGDLDYETTTSVNNPVVDISSLWNEHVNIDFIELVEAPGSLSVTRTYGSSALTVNKLDSTSAYSQNATYEMQFYKPSLSNRFSVDITFKHRSDDFYVAFSGTSSYRTHTENSLTQDWDRPLGTRCVSGNAYNDEPVNASTIVVLFSNEQKSIQILQRNDDNTFNKFSLRSYSALAASDRYLIEITNQMPKGLKGTKKRKSYESTWVYVKQVTGTKLNLIGYAELGKKLKPSSNGLGYFVSTGFIESSYSNGSNEINSVKIQSLPDLFFKENDVDSNFKYSLLSDEGLSLSKHYLGQKLLSGLTDFSSFKYIVPDTAATPISVSAATTGTNVDIANISSLTIDGVVLTSLANNSYVLIKDQTIDSQNGLYQKTSSAWSLSTTTYNRPLSITGGTLNASTKWYKTQVQKDTNIVDKFLANVFFFQTSIGEISSFISGLNLGLLEFRLNWLKVNKEFSQEDLKIRIFSDSNDSPSTALTNWITVDYSPTTNSYIAAPNSSLIQVPIRSYADVMVNQGSTIWIAVSIPFNSALAEANGPEYINQDYFTSGSYSGYQIAKNLWHKLFAYYEVKAENSNHRAHQQFRVRATSHADISSYSSLISDPAQIDINPPTSDTGVPKITAASSYNLRYAELSIEASDTDSGILAFRIGREIDNSSVEYSSWLPWSKYATSSNGLFYLHLYGTLNYYRSGSSFSDLANQNMGFTGARKVKVQLMDYAGNVSESYPLSFVVNASALVDTEAPYGEANFYNPRTQTLSNLSNLPKSWVKMDASDLVSGIKDFKIRRIYDSGPGTWSEWEPFSSYRVVDFTGESDGVKRVEFAFRDYGNNITQPEILWETIERPI